MVIGVMVLNSTAKGMSKEESLRKEFVIELKNVERNIEKFSTLMLVK